MLDKIVSYALLFFAFSTIGWMLESLYCSIPAKRFINRGFLTGPMCPIYGAGVLVMAVCLTPFAKYPLLVPVMGILLCDTVEFMTSLIMEKLFHARWWDYSEEFGNIQGRICLKHTLYWCMLSTVYVYVVHPVVLDILNKIPMKVQYILVGVISVVFVIDYVYSFISAKDIRKLKKKIADITNKLDDIANTDTAVNEEEQAENPEGLKAELAHFKADMLKDFSDAKAQADALFAKVKGRTARFLRINPRLSGQLHNSVSRMEEKIEEMKKRFSERL